MKLSTILKLINIALAFAAAFFGTLPPLYLALLVAMGGDVLLGNLAAIKEHRLSSSIALEKSFGKVAVLIFVATAHFIDQYAVLPLGFALASLLAAFYLYRELLSMIEHAAVLGAPVPDVIRDALLELRRSASEDAPGDKPTILPAQTRADPQDVEPKPPAPHTGGGASDPRTLPRVRR